MKNNHLLVYRTRIESRLPSWIKGKVKRIGFIVSILLLAAVARLLTSNASQIPLSEAPPQQSAALEQMSAEEQIVVTPPGEQEPPCTPSDRTIALPGLDEIDSLFDGDFFYGPSPPARLSLPAASGDITVCTTLDPEMQKRLIATFKQYSPMLAAGVVLDARTGAVLAMGNYCRTPRSKALLPEQVSNYCLYSGFPAASLIKVITAAAVVEKKGFSNSEMLPVSGQYHTLYRSQLDLQGKQSKHVRAMSLEDAFANSVNPFFGKLGIRYLSDEEFASTAREFLFDRQIEFDLPVMQSTVFRPNNDFERAELASGYNTRTTISPLHAALIGALPLTGGRLMRPYIVERIIGADGKELYRAQAKVLAQPLTPQGVANLTTLMQATVQEGTGRRSFARLRRIREFSKWSVGGKTGAMNLPENARRCEWFAGFAENDETRLALAVVVVHGENRTVRPGFVAAEIIGSCMKEPAVKTAAVRVKHRGKKGRSLSRAASS